MITYANVIVGLGVRSFLLNGPVCNNSDQTTEVSHQLIQGRLPSFLLKNNQQPVRENNGLLEGLALRESLNMWAAHLQKAIR